MKIAVVHEWLIDWAGSEKVLEQILQCFPDADLFALVDFLPDSLRHKLAGKKARTTFLQKMPWARSQLAAYLPLMPIAIEQLDLSDYDVVISNSHAVAKAVITSPDQLHISYVHSPMRYAWDLQHEYLRGSNGRGLTGFVLRWILHYLRNWDYRTANGVDAFIANSHFIAKRIHKVYRRDAEVVHPPVDLDCFSVGEPKEDYYLCFGRLMPYKRIDLAVSAFASLPSKRLMVVGEGPELASIKKSATPNVSFVSAQPQDALRRHLGRAKALIFPGKEDFGITPLEAQACGTPVIAYGQGGVLETVLPLGSCAAPTGVLFGHQSAEDIVEAIQRFESAQDLFNPAACRANAERFSAERFCQKFMQIFSAKLAEHQHASPAHASETL